MGVEEYRVVEKLGKGAFSTVYKVERRANGQTYACKRIDITKMAANEIADSVNEIRILASIRHPLWIVMENCACGDLASKVERYRKKRKYMDERVVWTHLIQMTEGLMCLHDAGIVHRDIKAANIFLAEDGSVKIGDLNVSKRMKGGNLLRTQIGTPYYMSPEVWLSKPYGMSSDIWAVGCLVYELCALRPPFVGSTFPQLKSAVLSGRYPALPRAFSYEMTSIVARMIRVNSRERPTCQQLLECQEIRTRRQADWYKTPQAALHPSENSKQDLLKTIVVPNRIGNLNAALPKACFPDVRPNSPHAWPIGQDRATAIETKNNKKSVAMQAAADEKKKPTQSASESALPIQPRGSAAALFANVENQVPPPVQPNVPQAAYAPSKPRAVASSGYGQPCVLLSPTQKIIHMPRPRQSSSQKRSRLLKDEVAIDN